MSFCHGKTTLFAPLPGMMRRPQKTVFYSRPHLLTRASNIQPPSAQLAPPSTFLHHSCYQMLKSKFVRLMAVLSVFVSAQDTRT